MAVAILTSVFVETLSALNSLGNSNVRSVVIADIRRCCALSFRGLASLGMFRMEFDSGKSSRCPLCPRKRTFGGSVEMGQLDCRRETLNRPFELDQGRHGREEYDYSSFF